MINVAGLTKQFVVDKTPKKGNETAPDIIRQEKRLISPSKQLQPLMLDSENPYENQNSLHDGPTAAQPASRPDSGNILRSKSLA